MSDNEDEWLVYSWVSTRGRHRVAMCTKEGWVHAWDSQSTADKLAKSQCTMLAEGLTEEQAYQFISLTRET